MGRRKKKKKGMGGILMKTFEMRKISMDTEREEKSEGGRYIKIRKNKQGGASARVRQQRKCEEKMELCKTKKEKDL